MNAIKHGGEDNAITVTVEARGDRIAIEVADRGPGIAEDDRAHLFEAFYRGRRALDRQIPEAALASVSSSTLHVSTAVASKWRARLPREARSHFGFPNRGMPDMRASKRILIVEDEPGLVLTLTDRLKAEGYAVDAVSDGDDAVGRARAIASISSSSTSCCREKTASTSVRSFAKEEWRPRSCS